MSAPSARAVSQSRRRRDAFAAPARACSSSATSAPWPSIPEQPATLYLGSELGLFVSTDGADNWTKLPAPLDGLQVWSLWIVPQQPEILIVGTCPSHLFRSEDGGRTWSEAAARLERECPRLLWTRVTCLVGDPDEPNLLWAGVEIDGVHHSRDGGRTWQPIGSGLSSRDIHALVIVPAQDGKPRRLLAATNNDLNISERRRRDLAAVADRQTMPWSYCRTLIAAVRPAGGDLARQRRCSARHGRRHRPFTRWRHDLAPAGRCRAAANSTIWNFAVHPADPRMIYASSVSGQVYRSLDGGTSWQRLPREFGEIRALAGRTKVMQNAE